MFRVAPSWLFFVAEGKPYAPCNGRTSGLFHDPPCADGAAGQGAWLNVVNGSHRRLRRELEGTFPAALRCPLSATTSLVQCNKKSSLFDVVGMSRHRRRQVLQASRADRRFAIRRSKDPKRKSLTAAGLFPSHCFPSACTQRTRRLTTVRSTTAGWRPTHWPFAQPSELVNRLPNNMWKP